MSDATPLGERALEALAEFLERPRSDLLEGTCLTHDDGRIELRVRLRPELHVPCEVLA